jgi:hypothetical protein
MQACAAGYVLTYLTSLELQLVSCMVVDSRLAGWLAGWLAGKLLLALAKTMIVILGSVSYGTHDLFYCLTALGASRSRSTGFSVRVTLRLAFYC